MKASNLVIICFLLSTTKAWLYASGSTALITFLKSNVRLSILCIFKKVMKLDFKKVINAVEPLAYSHALVVLNKKQIITKLLAFIGP
jgi:hypothetical protein